MPSMLVDQHIKDNRLKTVSQFLLFDVSALRMFKQFAGLQFAAMMCVRGKELSRTKENNHDAAKR